MKILINALPQRELVSNHMNKMAPKTLHVKDESKFFRMFEVIIEWMFFSILNRLLV